jgi:hypothetical protein
MHGAAPEPLVDRVHRPLQFFEPLVDSPEQSVRQPDARCGNESLL